jgi:3-oxoacyl-[acyl-carrier-protein] synthase III
MAVPARRVSNREIATRSGVDEAWIAKRTGTRERPWAAPGERMSEFAARAGGAALARAGIQAAQLDLVLVATSTADEITPNAAPLVVGLLGADRAGALDVGAACTGWLSALALACGQIESGPADHALVIGADFLSQFLDPTHRETAPLFADGAGAVVVASTGGTPETFRAAVKRLSEVTVQALDRVGIAIPDVDLFVYHQANSRIIKAVGQRLGLPARRVVDYVDRFANASTATLPIALSVAESEGRLQSGDRVLLAAFGGGFTWGAAVVRWGAP